MKKTLLFASAAVLLCGCGTGSKYVVEGHIAGLEGTVYMFEGDSLIDSAVVEGGKFRFEGPADITARRPSSTPPVSSAWYTRSLSTCRERAARS